MEFVAWAVRGILLPKIREICFREVPSLNLCGMPTLVTGDFHVFFSVCNSIPDRGNKPLSSPQRSDRMWGPLDLLSVDTAGFFPRLGSDHSPSF